MEADDPDWSSSSDESGSDEAISSSDDEENLNLELQELSALSEVAVDDSVEDSSDSELEFGSQSISQRKLHNIQKTNQSVVTEIVQLLQGCTAEPEGIKLLLSDAWDQINGNNQGHVSVVNAMEVVDSLKIHITLAHQQEPQSGAVRSLISAAAGDLSVRKLASTLDISKAAAERGHQLSHKRKTEWNENKEWVYIFQKPVIKRPRKSTDLDEAIIKFMASAFTASSNSQNVVKRVNPDTQEIERTVTHWRTDTWEVLLGEFKSESGYQNVSIEYFKKFKPWFVRPKKYYSGLCDKHDIGFFWENSNKAIRLPWHGDCNCESPNYGNCQCYKRCECDCNFCVQCEHGDNPEGRNGDCWKGTCTRCNTVECPIEWDTEIDCTYTDRYYAKADNGRRIAFEEEVTESRDSYMARISGELLLFHAHEKQVQWWRRLWRFVQEYALPGHLFIRWDFIQNYVHQKAYAMSFDHFGKQQTAILTAFVVYRKLNGELVKRYYDFMSSYICHNHHYYKLALRKLLTTLKEKWKPRKLHTITDGCFHFASKDAFWVLNKISKKYKIRIEQWTTPPSHGKSECDSHGAVVKEGAKRWLTEQQRHIDTPEELAEHVNNTVDNTTAFVLKINKEGTIETDEVDSVFKVKSHYCYQWNREMGKYKVKELPCYCSACRMNTTPCENEHYCGKWDDKVQVHKGKKMIKAHQKKRSEKQKE